MNLINVHMQGHNMIRIKDFLNTTRLLYSDPRRRYRTRYRPNPPSLQGCPCMHENTWQPLYAISSHCIRMLCASENAQGDATQSDCLRSDKTSYMGLWSWHTFYMVLIYIRHTNGFFFLVFLFYIYIIYVYVIR